MRPAYLFIRDDDVTTSGGYFKEFFTMLLENRMPAVYAVIPGGMDRRLIGMLKRQKARTPDLLDIVQHGWSHRNYAGTGESKYEFGPSRTEAVQRRDLARGIAAMRLAFGNKFTPVFVPPFHGYDAVTLALVEKAGFLGFSAGKKVFPAGGRILDVPAGVSFSVRGGQGVPFDHRQMLRRLAGAIKPGRLSGILLHHEEIAAQSAQGEIALFFKALARWRDKGGVRIILLSEALARRTALPSGF